MDVYLLCFVSSGRGLCDELITRPDESYRLLITRPEESYRLLITRPEESYRLLITRPEESYRLRCIVVCDLETS